LQKKLYPKVTADAVETGCKAKKSAQFNSFASG
jgi:hypothetical protein